MKKAATMIIPKWPQGLHFSHKIRQDTELDQHNTWELHAEAVGTQVQKNLKWSQKNINDNSG